ncbi:virginiamycin B lyase family protein [Streptomyces cinereoruber]|uniref:virginiamycin B lyase family protein n=1 Tax=Streptomyces cinereoruber TaxID=67260 RepID=UPI003C2F9228
MSIQEHAVADPAAGPYALTTGPDGALWFTLVHGDRIGRLVPGREPTSHRLAPDSGPTVITPGPDGALWTALEIGALARVAPADSTP